MPLADGATFAGYTIVRLLGTGGMGEVYLAQHPRLPRREALKILPADVSTDPEFRGRFAREADLAATLYHPHIVGVHDRGEFAGQLWISMDYVAGPDAGRLLGERYPVGMPRQEALEIVSAVAEALDYAHQRGLLHRDVKPANILLTRPESGKSRILLADFGIARRLDDISGLTATNMTVGTVNYAAPEQLMDLPIDGRTDQYALAATAFHLLAASPPFTHSNPAVVISHHLNAAPPALSDGRPELVGLDSVFAVALAKDPKDRFPRCRDFARALTLQAVATPGAAKPLAPTAPAPATRKPAPPMRTAHLPVPTARPPRTPMPAPMRGRRFSRVQLGLAAAAVLMFATAALLATLLIIRNNIDSPRATKNEAVPPAPSTTETTAVPLIMPGTDPQGFLGYPDARCNPGSTPAVMARTTKSVLVICQNGPGNFYYRGVRVSDGASIELANAVRSSGGFDATNPGDGTRYEVRPNQLAIVQPDGRVFPEPMVQYASS